MPIPIYGEPAHATINTMNKAAPSTACKDVKLINSFVKRGIAILAQLKSITTKDITIERLAILKDDISIAYQKIDDKEIIADSMNTEQ